MSQDFLRASLLFLVFPKHRSDEADDLFGRRLLSQLALPIIQQWIVDSGVDMRSPGPRTVFLESQFVGRYNGFGMLIETQFVLNTEQTWDIAKEWMMPLMNANWSPELKLLSIDQLTGFMS